MSDLVETRYCLDQSESADASFGRLTGRELVPRDQILISRDAEIRALSAWALLIDRYFDTPVVSFVVARASSEHKPIGANAVKRLSLQIEHEWSVQQLQEAVSKAKDTREEPDGKDSTSNTAVLLLEASDTNADLYGKGLEDLFQQLGNIPLLLTMCPTSQGLSLGVYSPCDRQFHIPLQAIIGSMKHSFDAMDRYDTPITGLDLISSYDVQRLRSWAIRGEVEPSGYIHDLINRHYRERQAAIAISSTSEQVTYEQLGQKSAAIADILLGAGVQSGCTVGFCMNKSTLAIITILGILRAGAVYVPISQGCSAQRMSEILERVGAKHFIAERHIQQRFEDIDPPEIQQIDPVSLDLERIPNAWDRDVDLDPSSLAYIVLRPAAQASRKGLCISITRLPVGYKQ
ncbi:uncharacterized protein LDX57_006451 [Aspergillus melleus]|uniref:uncharacterized protein n=1 Tax=Aspergillus melleus TaxID=138277 RepID=UPI001E8DD39C|nr:uncharacterized protein LDX57_006451 [Aspergillus melleus]KAH8428769.1 hypothetical protein LDX57_006451 [Aspergillus melleus]